jgi:choline dehydrogenase-like flavoprotein
LIVDYGFIDRDPAELQPNITAIYPSRDLFNVTSVPQRFLNNQPQRVWSASVVGGGSIINGMYFFRGSAEDYDNWEKLGNPGWGWKGLLPYFKKVY